MSPRRNRWRGKPGRRLPAGPPPDIKRVLVVEGMGFSAQAMFQRHRGKWRVIRADPGIDWMLRMQHCRKILHWIKAKGYSFYWLGRDKIPRAVAQQTK